LIVPGGTHNSDFGVASPEHCVSDLVSKRARQYQRGIRPV
jgi:hypothetical protein